MGMKPRSPRLLSNPEPKICPKCNGEKHRVILCSSCYGQERDELERFRKNQKEISRPSGMRAEGNHKTAGDLTKIGGQVVEVLLHRKPEDLDVSHFRIIAIDYKRVGRGKAAMKPGAEKELLIKVRYFDES